MARFFPMAVWLALAGFAVLSAWRFPSGAGMVPGPRMVPMALAILLAIMAVILGVAASRLAVSVTTVGGRADRPGRDLIGLTSLMALYAVFLPLLGFISTSALFVAAALRLLGYPHLVRALAFGLVVGFSLYGFFEGLMGVPLPKGWLG